MITSLQNDVVKHFKSLSQAKGRQKTGEFLLEGTRLVEEALACGLNLTHVLYTEEVTEDARVLSILRSIRGSEIAIESVSPRVFSECSETVTPQGIIAASQKFAVRSIEEIGTSNDHSNKGTLAVPLYLVLDAIQDPGNLGTIIRTACAAGIRGLILGKGTVDLYNPKVIRSAMGAAFRLPIYVDVDLIRCVNTLREHGFKTFAAAGEAVSSYTDIDFRCNTLIIVGNEGRGVSHDLKASVDDLVSIPMARGVESLNAGISASVIAYEALRQNNNPGL